jgi:hypothetical protein
MVTKKGTAKRGNDSVWATMRWKIISTGICTSKKKKYINEDSNNEYPTGIFRKNNPNIIKNGTSPIINFPPQNYSIL